MLRYFILSLIHLTLLSVMLASGFLGETQIGSQVSLAASGLDDTAFEALRGKLASTRRRVRRSALAPLAAMDRLRAWELLVEALDDPSGEVADGAQLLLGQLDSEQELELILGKQGLRSKSIWVRKRVSELLGRVRAEVPAGALLRGLKDRDREVRRMAAWSIERLCARGSWAELENPRALRDLGSKLKARVTSDRDERVRARALCALARLDSKAARGLHDAFLRSKSLGLRCVALKLAALLLDEEQALELLGEGALGKERLLRGQAQESLALWGTKASLGALIECLPGEQDERLRFVLLQNLRRISGAKHRADVRPWRAWHAGLAGDWKAPDSMKSGRGKRASRREADASSSSFSGLQLRSKHLTFLIDLSGSMWTPGADGSTPKQLVHDKLARALEGMPGDVRFNLIPFTGRPHPWKDSLMPASKRNKRRALDFFGACSQRGSGNFWAAAMLALEDPDVDTLVLLGDGAPSGGERHELELIVSHFVEQNLTRRVAMDSILVDASRHLEGYWRRLATATGGESISVVFP